MTKGLKCLSKFWHIFNIKFFSNVDFSESFKKCALGANGHVIESQACIFHFFTTNVFHTIILIPQLSMAGLPLENAY